MKYKLGLLKEPVDAPVKTGCGFDKTCTGNCAVPEQFIVETSIISIMAVPATGNVILAVFGLPERRGTAFDTLH